MKAFLALLAILAWPASALADTSACWEELRFSAGQGWATATTTLRFSTIPSSQAALVTAAGGRDLLPGGESVGLLEAELNATAACAEKLGEAFNRLNPEEQAAATAATALALSISA